MKRFLKIIGMILLFPFILSFGVSDYCDGWESGYIEGWKYNQTYAEGEPIIPICPIPEIDKDTYQSGYNDGFLRGKSDYESK